MSVNPEAPKEAKEEVKEEVVDEVAVELAAVKAQLEDMKKQAAEAGLKHKAPTVNREPLNLKNLSTQERVSALLQNFSK
jgi:2-methylcitrate dehydratase PrpD